MPHKKTLSSLASMLVYVLEKFSCPVTESQVSILFGSPVGFRHAFDEAEKAGVLQRERSGAVFAPGGAELTELRPLTSFNAAEFPQNSIASAILAHRKKDWLSFITSAEMVFSTVADSNDTEFTVSLFGILSAMISDIPTSVARKNYAYELITRLKGILENAGRSGIAKGSLDNALDLLRAVAEKVGDIRTISYVDLTRAINAVIYEHPADSSERLEYAGTIVRNIFDIGDYDILRQSSRLILLYYMLTGEYLRCLSFYANIANMMLPSPSHDWTIVTLNHISASCALFLGRYRLAENLLEESQAQQKKTGRESLHNLLLHIFLYVLMENREQAYTLVEKAGGMIGIDPLQEETLTCYRLLAERAFNVQCKTACKSGYLTDRLVSAVILNPFLLDILDGVVEDDKLCSEILERYATSPVPLLKGKALQIKGKSLLLKKRRQAMDCLNESAALFRRTGVKREEAKTFLLIAGLLRNHGSDHNAFLQYVLRAWNAYQAAPQFPWPQEFNEYLPKQDIMRSGRDFTGCSSFFTVLRFQNYFGHYKSLQSRVLYSLIITFSMQHGICFRLNGGDAEILVRADFSGKMTAAELDERLKDKFEAICKDNSPVVDIDFGLNKTAHFYDSVNIEIYLPVKTDASQYLLYARGYIFRNRISSFSTEALTIICNYLRMEFTRSEKLMNEKKSADSPGTTSQSDEKLYCASRAMRDIVSHIDAVAPKNIAVLLLGESGVGKELLARRLHEKSGRKGAFVAVNIANTPSELFESEFYGHEKGSFTGANYQKKGLFELADDGTLFIDEVGDIPLFLQVKLLRVLQEHTFRRVGGTQSIRSDFRLVAATNQDLPKKIAEGKFREDLYYRLNVVSINIPPLRERREDIELLSRRFMEKFSVIHGVEPRKFTPEIWNWMMAYAWPGNVRQLSNFIERYSLSVETELPQVKAELRELPDVVRWDANGSGQEGSQPDFTMKEIQDRYFEYVYKKKCGVIGGASGVAATLGISKPTAISWMNRLGLRQKYHLVLNDEQSFGA